jgi:hypothetical protein
MDEHRKLQRRHLGESAGLGERDLRFAPRGLLRVSGRAEVSSSASFCTRSGACRMMVKAMKPPIESPASAKRGGAAARMRLAIASMLSLRVWSATCTGPNRHSAGICSA